MNQVSQFAARGAWSRATAVARATGAVSLLAVGGLHLEQYALADYSAIPTIGWLFLANFIGASILGLALLAPPGWTGRRWSGPLGVAAAVGGLGLAAGSLGALLLSEHTPLFGFMEQGYRPVIVLAIATDAVAIVALSATLAWGGGLQIRAAGQSYPPL